MAASTRQPDAIQCPVRFIVIPCNECGPLLCALQVFIVYIVGGTHAVLTATGDHLKPSHVVKCLVIHFPEKIRGIRRIRRARRIQKKCEREVYGYSGNPSLLGV